MTEAYNKGYFAAKESWRTLSEYTGVNPDEDTVIDDIVNSYAPYDYDVTFD